MASLSLSLASPSQSAFSGYCAVSVLFSLLPSPAPPSLSLSLPSTPDDAGAVLQHTTAKVGAIISLLLWGEAAAGWPCTRRVRTFLSDSSAIWL